MKSTENPVCTTDFDLPTPPWGQDHLDPGKPHPDEPGLSQYGTEAPVGGEPIVGSDRADPDGD